MPELYARWRGVERHGWNGGVEVFRPRLLVGPRHRGYGAAQGVLYYAAVRPFVDRIRRGFRFDLIHAHFTYPDGVVAVRLGRRYSVPVVITEHVPWQLLERHPRVLRWAARAACQCAYHISVSESARNSVEKLTGARSNLVVIPNGVDGSLFTPAADGRGRKPGQVVYAGALRATKGVDILLKSLRLLADRGTDTKLILVGGAFYGSMRESEMRLRQMASDLGLNDRVQFVDRKVPRELVPYMQESAALVLPSRMESFGMVLVEALACGTPVVATRCGGPEEIVNPQVGVLVPPEDPEALATGIAHVLEHQADYDRARLRAYALNNFGLDTVGRRLEELYYKAVGRFARV